MLPTYMASPQNAEIALCEVSKFTTSHSTMLAENVKVFVQPQKISALFDFQESYQSHLSYALNCFVVVARMHFFVTN